MSYNLGSYNREGQISEAEAAELKATETGPTGLEGRVRLGDEAETDDEIVNNEPALTPTPTVEPIQVTAEGEFVDEAASDSDAAESDEVETEVVDADADGDGHHDETGQFVEGNQEAAAPDAGEAA
jgi:hypothetical protein